MQVETVTTAPQTTQTTANPSGKHWAGCTLNNWTPAHEAAFLANIQPIADYYVYGKEVGASGTPHLQFMVCFKKQTRLSAVRKLLPAHWFVKSPKSTMQQASDYCKKDGNFIEFGTYLKIKPPNQDRLSLINMLIQLLKLKKITWMKLFLNIN